MVAYLILGATYAFAAAVQPGPLQTYLILTLASIIVLFASAGNLGPRVGRTLVGASVIALACFGCYQLWSGLRALLL
jgi:hypothetical protein